jgi:lysophospholipase L1-like esterase
VTRGRHGQLHGRIAVAAAGLVACCLVLALWAVVRNGHTESSRAVSSVLLQPGKNQAVTAGEPASAPRAGARPSMLSVDTPLAACEGRIERQAQRLPTVAIVGASYTAGTGPNNPELSWAVDLARVLHWNAVIYGVSGAGYVRTGSGGQGPMARMLAHEGLHALGPALVIVQAGHDDIGVHPGFEAGRVSAAVSLIHQAAPNARIGLITTFAASPGGTPALHQTDHTIVATGRAADPRVIIMDPLAGHWSFPRAAGNALHPTAAGDEWIAHKVAATLREHGAEPAAGTSTTPVICDVSVGERKSVSATA